jgi:hypothetical protein
LMSSIWHKMTLYAPSLCLKEGNNKWKDQYIFWNVANIYEQLMQLIIPGSLD